MKKRAFCGTINMLFFILVISSEGYGEENHFQLEEVRITASPAVEVYERASQEVKVLKQEELRKFGLEVFSSLDLRERGGFGVQEDLSLRGSTFEQNFLLLEGVKITDLQTSHHLMNLPFNEGILSKVEILSGGASPLYGGGGFGGGINFLLEPSKRGFEFKAGLGSYDFKEWELKAGLPIKKILNFQLFQKKSHGFIWNRDFDIRNFNLYTKDPQTTLFYGFIEKDFGARHFYTPRFIGEWEETRTHLFLVKKLLNIGEILFEPALLYRKNYDNYLLDRKNPAFYRNRHETYLYRIKLPFSFEKKGVLYGWGFEGSYENWEGLLKNGALKRELLRREYALFAFLKPKIGDRLFPTLQVRYDLHPGEKDFLSLGGGISYLISKNWKYRFSLNHSYRLPSATELYYDSFGIKGKPDLSAEKALNFETGFDFFQKNLFFSLTFFHRKGWNLIDWIYNGTTTVAENLNLKTLGLTFDLKKNFEKHSLALSYTYLNHFGDKIAFARYHGNSLRHNFILGMDLKLPYQNNLSVLLNYQKRYNQEGTLILDLKLEKDLSKNLKISLWGKNLLDETYYEIKYPEAGKGVLGIPQWFGIKLEGSF